MNFYVKIYLYRGAVLVEIIHQQQFAVSGSGSVFRQRHDGCRRSNTYFVCRADNADVVVAVDTCKQINYVSSF